MVAKAVKATDRSTNGLRHALFEELDALRGGKTTAQKASAMARLAAGILSASKLDIEYQRFVKSDHEAGSVKKTATPSVPSLQLVKN